MTTTNSLEMLRRVTRQLATTEDLLAILASMADALVEHVGATHSRIYLLIDDDECDRCRTHDSSPPNGKPALHLLAVGGDPVGTTGPFHRVPTDATIPIAYFLRGGVPVLVTDLINDPRFQHPAILAGVRDNGLTTAASFPLVYRGEILGIIGMMSQRPIDPPEFELLGIFADQAAVAIKGAYSFRELARYKDRLQTENAYLQAEIQSELGFEGIVGTSPALQAVVRKVKQVAAVDTTVLLTGETGTGKELVARAVHEGSPRKDRPLIKVNCGAIPAGVVESELFGHEKGAFTGALQRRIGRFELADNGTLFMDEAGELTLDTQVKLLRVLQEQEFERVGSTHSQKVDVRLIAATNRDLERDVANGRFRSDLYYRLNVFPIRIPPLRERAGDIPLLVAHFLAHFQRKLGKPLKGVTTASMARLERYAWPGNIRELQNVVERACVLATSPVVDLDPTGQGDRPEPVASEVRSPDSDGPLLSLEESERAHIRRALSAANGKVHGPAGAATLLGINASTLRSRMQKLGIAKSAG